VGLKVIPVAVSPNPTPMSSAILATSTTWSTGTTLVSSGASRPACAAWACGPSSTSATSICGLDCWAFNLATVSVDDPGM